MPTLRESFPAIVGALSERFGDLPNSSGTDDVFRKIVASALGQSGESGKLSRMLDRLSEHDMLDPRALAEADPLEVGEVLRDAGSTSSTKLAALVKRLARWIVEGHQGSADALVDAGSVSTAALREQLLAINGVGPRMADVVLLSALGRPVYPLDRATFRVLVRHGWLDPTAESEEARETIEPLAGDDANLLQSLSAWMERLGREFCRASTAKCDQCPLRPFLEPGGPRMEA